MIRRTIFALTLLLGTASMAFPQDAPAPTESTTAAADTATTAAPAATTEAAELDESRNPQAVRERFTFLLDRHPDEVSRILALDPTLLSNQEFLARYPEIVQFLAENPEIQRNPHYYVHQYGYQPRPPEGPMEQVFEALSIAFVFSLIAYALAWLVRTIIEQKRWNRLSRTQAEVHTKILDRFASSEEVLAYIKTPAGTKFLESAPIPVRTEPVRGSMAPFGRVLWSIQAGVVITVTGLGMVILSGRFEQEAAREFFALGAVAFSIGVGFIASAVVSLYLTRRLGLWQQPPASETVHDPGIVR
jgi:hypothetical protein